MLPFLRADDEVLVNLNAYRRQSPHIGDVVVACHPTKSGLQIIKRIMDVDEAGRYHLRGDNPDHTRNSSVPVPLSLIHGRVTSRFEATAELFCSFFHGKWMKITINKTLISIVSFSL